ncbi:GNAT family N-acetyltransferase [Vibrio sp. LaRot3]|uniref:GNAT family N-acetyltransferase n=1 Tax=Vibrio sp. LaRot3 TaxID=2998829 RepID=UPI0022CE1EC9|nr:GNAT family N-acetyltransferase [Vibrio sp. LaRot3]MDA0150198.1 GNAT family N-acetyltransferase [Vibrio sp. LaRot3]
MTPITEKDWPLFRRLLSEPQVIRHCFDAPSESDARARFESRLPTWSVESEHWLCLVMVDKQSQQPIGVTGCVMENGIAELGYLLLPEFFGRQYGTESLAALLELLKAQCGVKQFKAVVTEGNIASERVLEKCGFRLGQVVPEAYEIGGRLLADHIYVLS